MYQYILVNIYDTPLSGIYRLTIILICAVLYNQQIILQEVDRSQMTPNSDNDNNILQYDITHQKELDLQIHQCNYDSMQFRNAFNHDISINESRNYPTNGQANPTENYTNSKINQEANNTTYNDHSHYLDHARMIGVVIENYQNGSRYEGEKLNGMRHGQGRFFYQDGGLYDGQWKANQMHGIGVLYYGNNKIAYNGQWIRDKFHGHGILYNENPVQLDEGFDFQNVNLDNEYWVKYEGEFQDDCKNGYGIYLLSNGEQFQGQFKEDCISGKGSYFLKDGSIIQGVWENNILTSII